MVAPEYQADMDAQIEIVSEGARILKDYTADHQRPVGPGAGAPAYFMLGAYAYLIELWGAAGRGRHQRRRVGWTTTSTSPGSTGS